MHLGRATQRMLMMVAVGRIVGACALIEAPTAQLDVARGAIAAAEASGASERAPIELGAARKKLAQAEGSIRRGDYVGAERLAEAAEADARLAAMKARAAAADNSLRTGRSTSGGAPEGRTQ